jgi:hypothetical protein
MKPTLEQVVEHFKDAEIVECLSNRDNCDITKNIKDEIYHSSSKYWIVITTHKGLGVELWSKEKGYAKIIKFKTKTMRKVILEEKKSEVYLSDLNEGSIVGVRTNLGGKFALSKTRSGYEFIGNGNLLTGSKTQYESLNKALIEMNQDVFIFDTSKDLFKWMSE